MRSLHDRQQSTEREGEIAFKVVENCWRFLSSRNTFNLLIPIMHLQQVVPITPMTPSVVLIAICYACIHQAHSSRSGCALLDSAPGCRIIFLALSGACTHHFSPWHNQIPCWELLIQSEIAQSNNDPPVLFPLGKFILG